jgi:ketosteroid isomerase-like protein
MMELVQHDIDKIQALHNLWLNLEIAGASSKLVELCVDEIQWMPPDAQPIVGKEAVLKYLNGISVQVESIDITNLSIRGSDSIAYLTSDYRTRFLTEGDLGVDEARGSHLWILTKVESGEWRLALLAWSSW